ncbi:hypothetical protein SAMN02799624_02424 [Paenibacillus sp. UNC496MF]|nr:hypothetical protein SAMN02799624_02424 [Paenibacillus sp. UNC496MF]
MVDGCNTLKSLSSLVPHYAKSGMNVPEINKKIKAKAAKRF